VEFSGVNGRGHQLGYDPNILPLGFDQTAPASTSIAITPGKSAER
jgi:hypothetical protein